MIFYKKNDYVAPMVEELAVRCESEFLNSTGGVEFEDGKDDGWVY